MTDSPPIEPPPIDPADEPDLQAAEYVLGALPPHQARALEALALNDPAVAASIAAWERRLAPLADLAVPTPPPLLLWRRLALATGIDSVIQPPVPSRAGPSGAGRRGAWRSAGLWRATTAGAMAIAAGLAFLLFTAPVRGPEPLIAALSPYGGPGATFLVRVGADGAATVVAVGDTAVPQGKSLELWALTAGATAPVSMGLLPERGRAQLTVPAQAGTQLLVSQEPVGGSVSKQPTGPVVFAGKLTGI